MAAATFEEVPASLAVADLVRIEHEAAVCGERGGNFGGAGGYLGASVGWMKAKVGKGVGVAVGVDVASGAAGLQAPSSSAASNRKAK